MEYFPILEVSDKSLDRRSKRRDLGIIFLVGHGQLAAFRFLLRGDQAAALVALVAEPAAGFLHDIRGSGLLECLRVVRLPGQRAGNPDGIPVEKRYQLRVEASGLVLLVPQLLVLLVGPAWRQRAVYQD